MICNFVLCALFFVFPFLFSKDNLGRLELFILITWPVLKHWKSNHFTTEWVRVFLYPITNTHSQKITNRAKKKQQSDQSWINKTTKQDKIIRNSTDNIKVIINWQKNPTSERYKEWKDNKWFLNHIKRI